LPSVVAPPSIQCTRWWPWHNEADRSHPGHWQWPSRACNARRSPPDMTRLVRPTSIATESWLRRTRVTLQSQAMRCTATEEMGSESSISPAAAPTRPFSVSIVAVTWMFAGLPPVASSTSASAFRWGSRRSSWAPDFCASRSRALRTAAPPTGSRTPLISRCPSSPVASDRWWLMSASVCSWLYFFGSTECR